MGVFRAPSRLVRLPAVVVIAGGSLVLAGGSAQAVTGDQIAAIAYAQLGKGCAGNGWPCHPDEWCADFAGWVWAQAGINTAGLNAAAASFVTYGRANRTIVTTPQVGDAIVYGFNEAQQASHVNLVSATRGDGAVETVGGNQGNSPGIVSLDGWHSVDRGAVIVQPVGLASQILEITGDWDGNGTSTPGIYRGNTFYLRNENSQEMLTSRSPTGIRAGSRSRGTGTAAGRPASGSTIRRPGRSTCAPAPIRPRSRRPPSSTATRDGCRRPVTGRTAARPRSAPSTRRPPCSTTIVSTAMRAPDAVDSAGPLTAKLVINQDFADPSVMRDDDYVPSEHPAISVHESSEPADDHDHDNQVTGPGGEDIVQGECTSPT